MSRQRQMSHESQEIDTDPGGDWTAPGAHQVAPGGYRIPLPMPNDGLRAVNVYALVDGDRLVVIDGGWVVPASREALEAALGAIDCSTSDIARFLVTHLHPDHYAQAVALRDEVGARVGLGIGERPGLRAVQKDQHAMIEPHFAQLRASGAQQVVDQLLAAIHRYGPGQPPPWDDPDDWLEEGPITLEAGRTLEALATPGHTSGHVVFVDPTEGLLFAGDHVLPTITPSIGFEPVISPDPLGAFLGSLARLRRLPDTRLLPAHGPVARSVHQRIDELLEHHGSRLDQTLAAVTAGSSTVYEVAGQLHWTRRMRRLDELDPFNQMLAVTETGAHLTLLQCQGRVMAEVDGGGLVHFIAG